MLDTFSDMAILIRGGNEMSRTYVHAPAVYMDDANKHYNTRNRRVKLDTRRLLRHAPIDEDGTELVNAEAERKHMAYLARNRYW